MASLGPAEFAAALHALLPRGPAWPREPGTVQAQAVEGLAAIVAAQHDRATVLLEIEADPAAAEELLADWERAYGLPDACVGPGQTFIERRAALLSRIRASGGQSPAYLIAVAASLGYAVTIEEHRPARSGVTAAGDPCNGEAWAHAFTVRGPEETITDAVAGATVAGDPLRAWGNLALECSLGRIRPAHTVIIFAYGSA